VTDNRSFVGDTVQVESIPPDVLTAIIEEAVDKRLDRAAYDAVKAKEEKIKKEFRRVLLPALKKIK
jgi:hypothetical protein